MGELLSECCDVEDVERIALGSAERVVSPIAVEQMFALLLKRQISPCYTSNLSFGKIDDTEIKGAEDLF
jgi:hypothetical protein